MTVAILIPPYLWLVLDSFIQRETGHTGQRHKTSLLKAMLNRSVVHVVATLIAVIKKHTVKDQILYTLEMHCCLNCSTHFWVMERKQTWKSFLKRKKRSYYSPDWHLFHRLKHIEHFDWNRGIDCVFFFFGEKTWHCKSLEVCYFKFKNTQHTCT